jgi:hypothetical protein
MKSIHAGKSHPLRYRRVSRGARFESNDDLKERVTTDSVLSAAFAVIVVLYVVMLIAICRWSHYASFFSPDGPGGQPLEQAMPY